MRDERLLAGLLLWIAMGGVAPAQEPGYLDLGDVTAGGDGLGTADPSNVGIHPDTGALVTERFRSFFSNEGANPQPVDGSGTAHDSPFIDVVFIIHTDQMEINSAGVVFDFDDGDDNPRAWGAILKGLDTNGPDYLEFGRDVVFEDGVAVHSPEGITYDLDALRAAHGNDRVRFVSAVAGENSSPAGPGSVSTYMILSGESEVLAVARFPGASNFGRFQELEIPEAARFLTLAVGAANSDVLHDHGAFGRARITSVPTVTAIDHLRVRGGAVVLEPGETKQLEVQAFLGGELAGVLADDDLAGLIYESMDPAVARVGESGLVEAIAAGSTEVLVSLEGFEASVAIFVGGILDLGDLVAGGDGTGTAPADHIGIDPRSGQFATASGGVLSEADPEADGLDPSPVPASAFLDAVFILRAPDPGAQSTTQQITQSGISFDFPARDAPGTTRDHILRDANGGRQGPVDVGRDVGFRSAVGIHSAAGFTIDLQAVRDAHGPDATATFLTYWGVDYCRFGNVHLYAILSDAGGVIDSISANVLALSGEQIAIPIPAGAVYLTLVTGSNGSDSCDHGTFANAVFLSAPPAACPEDGDTSCDSLTVEGPAGGIEGVYSLTAAASDEGGDASLLYTFVVRLEDGEELMLGPVDSPAVELDLPPGRHEVSVTVDDDPACDDASAAARCSVEVVVQSATPFVRGDCNGDDAGIDISDAVFLLLASFAAGPAPPCAAACDVNGDGALDGTADAVFLVTLLFRSDSPSPPPPFPLCGPGTLETDPALGCASATVACQ